jgi:hypothetical protein
MEENEAIQNTRNLVLSICDIKQQGETPFPSGGAGVDAISNRLFLFGGSNETGFPPETQVLDLGMLNQFP